MDEDKQIIRNEWGIMRQYNGEVVSHPLHGPIGSRETEPERFLRSW